MLGIFSMTSNGQALSVTSNLIPGGNIEICFRSMQLQDIPRVHEIDRLSFSLPWPENSYQFELTRNPSSLARIVEAKSKGHDPLIIGMSVVWIILDEAHIATLAIHPEFRGHGYGKKLLADALHHSIHHGAKLATLEVRTNNLNAQQLYRSFGFNITGHRPHYYRDNNEDALIMTVGPLGVEYLSWLEGQ